VGINVDGNDIYIYIYMMSCQEEKPINQLDGGKKG
jgi:hypothetical protein